MSDDNCPQCGAELRCLGGHSAHPNNWYCPECPSPTLGLTCAHGGLARSCEICEAWNDHAAACDQNSRLRAELEALRADAERYRWLRERINWEDKWDLRRGIVPRRERHWTHYDYRADAPASEHIDEYIDAAKGAA